MNDKPTLADDFLVVTQNADQRLLSLMEQANLSKTGSTNTAASSLSKQTSNHASPIRAKRRSTMRSQAPSQPSGRQMNRAAKPRLWSSPTTAFNTRLPPEMAERIDDLAYRLKKQNRRPVTKQSLALEAFEDLLRKHAML